MPVGFDHFALPGDALAIAARTGQLRRNFQGFTEDDSSVLIGLGASSISQFPDRLIQNEKNSGTYRALCMGHRLPGARGVMRDAEDRMRALIIEDLLCMGSADISELGDLDAQAGPLAPFLAHGLATLSDGLLTIPPAGLPYARSIAALFDRYRAVAPQRFSSAI
jgi:oxygen-independent coproporphyrinogen-3 oxidase